MSETKHTPGPWMVCVGNEGSIFGDLNNPEHNGDNPYIGTVAGIGVDKDIPECTANAKLIAAAPDMLNALIDAKKHLEEYCFGDNQERTDVFNNIGKAIDKATGN